LLRFTGLGKAGQLRLPALAIRLIENEDDLSGMPEKLQMYGRAFRKQRESAGSLKERWRA
jgi:hypothetical protein